MNYLEMLRTLSFFLHFSVGSNEWNSLIEIHKFEKQFSKRVKVNVDQMFNKRFDICVLPQLFLSFSAGRFGEKGNGRMFVLVAYHA